MAEKAEKRRPVVRLPGKKQETSAEAGPKLMADLQSPSEMRRRGAKSALGWMTFGDESVYDSYSDSVAVAEEWEAWPRRRWTRSCWMCCMSCGSSATRRRWRGWASNLADVGKRTPNALMTIGMAPGECHALFTELLLGGARAARSRRGSGRRREPLAPTRYEI